MRTTALRALLVPISAGLLVLGGASAAGAEDHPGGDDHSTVGVTASGSAVDIDREVVPAGTVRFEVATTNPLTAEGGGSEVTMFRLRPGVTLEEFFADLALQFSERPEDAAASTRGIDEDATIHGLAFVAPDHPAVVTQELERGTYYLMDLATTPTAAEPPAVTELRVTGYGDDDRRPLSDLSVTAHHLSFDAPRHWPSEGSFSFVNRSGMPHMALLVPVADGTTDDAVQAAFDGTGPDVTREGPGGGADVVSPGGRLQLGYDLPAGTYALMCFVADAETGIPHAVLGMHRVVVLH
ncbi:hypothetical protein [Geodermatophilus sp. CPCC 206100]|uniref:hypothetical protein n=1 Tax=Geodermatophilus sp. CPCC 206100 TaxID=3020054 RepID=UPI003AFFD052